MNDCCGAWVRQAAEEGAACPGNGARSPTSTLETQLCYDEALSETSARIYAIKWMSNLAQLEKPTLEAPCACSRMGEAIAGTGLVHGPPPHALLAHANGGPLSGSTPSFCLARQPLSSMLPSEVYLQVHYLPSSAYRLRTLPTHPSLPACPHSDTASCHNNTP